MVRAQMFFLLVAAGALPAFAQAAAPESRSAKDTVQQFFAFETAGGRLRPEGWKNAEQFLVRTRPLPDKTQVFVVYKNYGVSDPVIKGDTAEVMVQILPEGRIGSDLRFSPSEEYKGGLLYRLVRTDKHWICGRDGIAKEVTGPIQWRIESVGPTLWLDTATAIRYVKDLRGTTDDPVVRKNADETVAKLAKLH